MAPTAAPIDAVTRIWQSVGLPTDALQQLLLTGREPAFPSSFAVGTAAQSSLAVAALAATTLGARRNGLRQEVSVDMREAALECAGRFEIDGRAPALWDKLSGLYRCGPPDAPGWLRLHTNFAHHRDGVLRLLGLAKGTDTDRSAVAAALGGWKALDFEAACTQAGLVVAALRTFDEWDRHPQSAAVAARPLVEIERIGDAAPLDWPALPVDARPLAGLRVLEATRILAGPVGGRTLAACGADVLLVNSPDLPNIDAIADTSRGKRSALADLTTPAGRAGFAEVLQASHVFLQGYRPGALAAHGFGPAAVASMRPGIVMVSLSAYGEDGPWGGKRGFDSLVHAACGFNFAEAEAAGESTPKALPIQILDMATGFLISAHRPR